MDKELEYLKALSHPVRLSILYSLRDSESKCVCEIQNLKELIEVSQSSLSQHLKVLRDSNLVKCEKRGGWVFYSVTKNSIFNILDSLKNL